MSSPCPVCGEALVQPATDVHRLIPGLGVHLIHPACITLIPSYLRALGAAQTVLGDPDQTVASTSNQAASVQPVSPDADAGCEGGTS
jgi:hypothetical protein